MSFDLGSQDLLKALGCMVLSGPFLTGYTQVGRRYPRTACCPFPETFKVCSFWRGLTRPFRLRGPTQRGSGRNGMVIRPSQLHPPSEDNHYGGP